MWGGAGRDPLLLTSVTTTYANGQTSRIQQSYDSGFTFTDTNVCCNGGSWNGIYGLEVTKTEYDYGNVVPGPALSSTSTNYLALSNSSYLKANLLNLVSSETILTAPASGNKCSETDYGYDVAAQIMPSYVTEQHVAAPSPGILGNLTSITKQLYSNPCQSTNPTGTPLTTKRYVYDTGVLQESFGPTQQPDDIFLFQQLLRSLSNNRHQRAQPIHPIYVRLQLFEQYRRGCDADGEETRITRRQAIRLGLYAASLSKRTILMGDKNSATFNYTPSSGGCGSSVTSTFTSATLTNKITSSLNKVTTQIFDGLGRLVHTQAVVPTSSTCSSGATYVDSTYDPDGRKFSVSNPYCTTGDVTYGLTKTYYDPLKKDPA